MTRWEPATEAEEALRDALLVNDQERYFRILSQVKLLLPVSADSLAGRAPMGWGTWSTGGRTHVLAFTSPEAMQICLGGSAASAREVRYTELAAAWPSAEWWLAVNPGLPIEGYLPAWFVGQLARGDSRLPGREPVSPAPVQPSSDDRVPPARREPVPPPVRARAAVPVPTPPPASPDPRIPSPSAVQPARDPQGNGRDVPSPAQAALDRPTQAAPVSPGIAGALPGWRGSPPATAGEGPNGLPRRAVPPRGTPEARADAPVATAVRQPPAAPGRDDHPARPPAPPDEAHRRGEAMGPAESGMRPDSAVRIDPGRVDPTTRIGPSRVDPTARIDLGRMDPATRVDPGRVEPTRGLPPGAPAEPTSPDFTPANEVESSLLAAAGTGSTDSFLSTLLLATVALPVAPGSAPGARPGDAGFVWRTEALDGEPYVVVFTSPARLVEHLGTSTDTVLVRFIQLIRHWPDRDWSFAVNPGTPVGAKLPGPEIVALANWAAEVGLGADESDRPADDHDRAGQAVSTPVPAQPARPTMMQKAIPPTQVGYYLERGYDRVSGFVHRAHEVAHLTSPAALCTALGLLHPNSPFSPPPAEVYVVRWPAHRPGLYRIPYGGQNESAMRAMEGWVIERPPFRGNGFAPGDSSDVVAEFKVDSVRLPHGAQLWRLGADGTETLIATLDSDVPRWRPAGEA